MPHPIISLAKRLIRLRRFPILVRRRGVMLLIDPANWIDNRLAAGAPYEDAQLAESRRLITSERLDLFIDVGANIGLYTVVLGRLDAIREIIAIEPVRRNFNQLLGNVFANRLDAKVDALRTALGNAVGEATIHIDPRSTGVARLDLETTSRSREVFSQTETISIARLDDLIAPEGRRIFMKMDVEGHAVPALEGMSRLLSSNHVVAQVELLAEDRDAIIAAMAKHGLRLMHEIEGDGYFRTA